jgi:hypothetical protein
MLEIRDFLMTNQIKVEDVKSPIRTVRQYVADFDIDAAAIGQLVAEGKQHSTYRYQDDKVIKIPKQSAYMTVYGRFSYRDITDELAIITKFLGDFVVPTRVLCTTSHSGYIIMQDFLHEFEFVTSTNFAWIEHDLIRVVEANRKIIQTHCLSLDLLGNKGLQRSLAASIVRKKELALMNNLLVIQKDGTSTVRLVDLNLIQLGRYKDVSLFRRLVDRSCFELSRYLLKDNFSLRI